MPFYNKRSFLTKLVNLSIMVCISAVAAFGQGLFTYKPKSSANDYYERGVKYHDEKKDYDKAIEEANNAISLDPNFWKAYLLRAMAYNNKKDYNKAVYDYATVIKLKPDIASAYNSLAWIYAWDFKVEFDYAIAQATQAIKLEPKDASYYDTRGWAYFGKGDYNSANNDFFMALKLDPNLSSSKDGIKKIREVQAATTPDKSAGGNINNAGYDQVKWGETQVATTPDKPVGTFTDSRDGQTYKTVMIGSQTWIAENLNYKTGNSWCYDNNENNCKKYGRLYDWETAKKACPKGWHLALYDDCEKLGYDNNGFSFLPGGFRDAKGKFKEVGNKDFYWSAENYGSKEALFWSSEDLCQGTEARFVATDKATGLSVRCVKHFIGERKEFYENGNLKSVENYNDNNRHGEWKMFYENGNLLSVSNYKDGNLNGEQKSFHPNGKLQGILNYKDGKFAGEQKSFHPNGKLLGIANYKDGKLIGELKMFDENGNLIPIHNDGPIGGDW